MDPARLVLAQQATTLRNLAAQRAANPAPAAPLRTLDDIRALAVQRHVDRHGLPALSPPKQVLAAQAKQLYSTQGRKIMAVNATPALQQQHLQDVALDMIRRGGGKRPAIVTVGDTGTFQETPGSAPMAPLGWANQQSREIRLGNQEFQDPAAMGRRYGPIAAHSGELMSQSTLAHEVGHLLEPDLVRNYQRARMWQDAHGIPVDPRKPVLARSSAGRAEMNRSGPVRRDQWGLPMEGLGGVHSAPNEQYADDVRSALGFPSGKLTPRMKAVLAELAKRKLIPKVQSGAKGLPIVRWPVPPGGDR